MSLDGIERERQNVARAKEVIRATKSPYLKRDLKKYVRRAEREIAQALMYMEESKCREERTQTALRT